MFYVWFLLLLYLDLTHCISIYFFSFSLDGKLHQPLNTITSTIVRELKLLSLYCRTDHTMLQI